MHTVADIKSLRERVAEWHHEDALIALVPTMGNLHKGHMDLVELAAEHAEHVVVSIFVNPTQFGAGEDFDSYPRTLEKDLRRLSRAGVDAVFTPSVEEMYPDGDDGSTRVEVPGLSDILCGAHRPGHFQGVTSVVCRLLNIVQPQIAIFGEKDYQQLIILQRMIADLHLPVRVLAGPTRREDDGLAMSSRNQYLDADGREKAAAIHASLNNCRNQLLAGNNDFATLEQEGLRSLEAAGLNADYFEVRKTNLGGPAEDDSQLIVLAAAKIGDTRLIDNVRVSR